MDTWLLDWIIQSILPLLKLSIQTQDLSYHHESATSTLHNCPSSKLSNSACLPNCSCRPCSITLKRHAVLPPGGRKQLLHLSQAQNKNDILFQQMRYQDPNWESYDWHRRHGRNTHWAWAFVKVWPAAIISARRATAGSNIRLAAATTSSPLPVKAHIHLGNLSARVDCTITIQCCPLDVKRQEFLFVHFAFIYHFCESFPVAWKKQKTVEYWMLQHQMWRLNLKTTYDVFFFRIPVYLMLFPANAVQKKGTDSIFVGFCSMFSAATRPEVKEQEKKSTSLKFTYFIHGLTLHAVTSGACIICHVFYLEPVTSASGQRCTFGHLGWSEGKRWHHQRRICQVCLFSWTVRQGKHPKVNSKLTKVMLYQTCFWTHAFCSGVYQASRWTFLLQAVWLQPSDKPPDGRNRLL